MQLMCFDSKMVAVPRLLIFFIISSKFHCYQHGKKTNKKKTLATCTKDPRNDAHVITLNNEKLLKL
jgi:hypothetical protein